MYVEEVKLLLVKVLKLRNHLTSSTSREIIIIMLIGSKPYEEI